MLGLVRKSATETLVFKDKFDIAEEMSRATMGSLLVSTGLGAARAFTFDSFRGRRGLGPPMSRFRVLACVGGIPRATKVNYCDEYLEGPACLHLRKPEKLFSRCRSDNVRETACDNLALRRISVNMRSCAFCISFFFDAVTKRLSSVSRNSK